MVQPVSPLGSASVTHGSQSSQEKQKLFEIQFETDVLGSYLASTRQNGSLKAQLDNIKKGLASGKSPDLLVSDLNSLISQINQHTPSPPFPSFSFTSEGSQVTALQYYCITLEKLIHSVSKGPQEQNLFKELASLWNDVGQISSEQAFGALNGVIEKINDAFPDKCHISTIPFEGGRR
jgi:hypothetical protein